MAAADALTVASGLSLHGDEFPVIQRFDAAYRDTITRPQFFVYRKARRCHKPMVPRSTHTGAYQSLLSGPQNRLESEYSHFYAHRAASES